MTTKLDLLKTIYNATISLPIKNRINPSFNTKPLTINQYYGSEKAHFETTEKTTHFNYTLNNQESMKFKYNIDIYKIDCKKFFGFVTKNERYLMRVQIYSAERYSSGHFKNEYFFDSEVDKSKAIKDTFEFLFSRNLELKQIEQSELFEKYVNDLSSIVDKSVMREETLNKILDTKGE